MNGAAFPNRLLAAATLDRLRHNAYCITLDGNSLLGGQYAKINLFVKDKNLALKRGLFNKKYGRLKVIFVCPK